jgi:hypothetical protein
MSGYIYTKNTYINFPNMFKYKKNIYINFPNMFKYKKNIYEIITYVLLGTHRKKTYINFSHMSRQKKGSRSSQSYSTGKALYASRGIDISNFLICVFASSSLAWRAIALYLAWLILAPTNVTAARYPIW